MVKIKTHNFCKYRGVSYFCCNLCTLYNLSCSHASYLHQIYFALRVETAFNAFSYT